MEWRRPLGRRGVSDFGLIFERVVFVKMQISRLFGALLLSGSAVFAATLTQVSSYGGSATSKAQM